MKKRNIEDVINPISLFMANNPKYIKAIGEEKRNKLIKYMKEMEPDDCACCVFYYNRFDKDGKCIGGGCSLDKNIFIKDSLARTEECPLNKEGQVMKL